MVRNANYLSEVPDGHHERPYSRVSLGTQPDKLGVADTSSVLERNVAVQTGDPVDKLDNGNPCLVVLGKSSFTFQFNMLNIIIEKIK